MNQVARLQLGDENVELPLVEGSEGERAVDISELRARTGFITLDEGYVNTGSTKSSITYLDGENGVLRYRGYPIETLAKNCDFVEVSYLLLHGELPTHEQLQDFRRALRRHTMLHEDMRSFYNGFPRDAHPMAILSSVVGALSTFYQDSLDPRDPKQVTVSIHRLIAKLPTIAAFSYKKSAGQPFIYPQNDLNYCENFLQMMFAVPCEPYEVDQDFVDALNLLLIVHADHEQNCSASTVRMVGSSDANLFAAISAGICALWGPLHGGANQACVEMLERIRDDGGNVKKYVDMAKDKDNNFRLMGFGHRVYKNYDPRATIIRETCAACSRSETSTTRSSTSPNNSKRWPCPIRTSSNASSTPTSISIRVLSTAPSASPCKCSPCCSPSDGCPAGSPSGKRCCTRQTNGSPVRGKSTPARKSGSSCRSSAADGLTASLRTAVSFRRE